MTRTSTRTRFTAIVAAGLIAAALVPASSAAYTDQGDGGEGSTGALLAKDPSAADVRVTKDPSAADPFVAEIATETPQPATVADDGFQWGDALIGAGATLAAVGIALAASGAFRAGRRDYPATPRGAASQSA